MSLQDLHTHTTFSDGKNTPEEMVQKALEMEIACIGFSDHGYTPFDERYCMKKGSESAYRAEIAALKEKYNGKIKILCGIEQDYYSESPVSPYDYAIGSVHYIKVQNEMIPIDESPESLLAAAKKHFGGDIYSLAEKYFQTVADVINKTEADIIGHFDLISKFNQNGSLFDEKNPRYVKAWQEAADMLLNFGKPFEINTGAISRGYKQAPYPSEEIIAYLKERGGKFLLSSDSHTAENLCFKFSEYTKFLTSDI